jgi:uncharacterized membrane protein HdeD (DUF308 family)
MTADLPDSPPRATPTFGKAPWWVLVIEGACLVVLGLLAGVAPLIASLAVTAIVGWVFMFAGGVRVVSGITHRGPGFGWSILTGCVALAAGLFLLLRPLEGLISLTMVLGAYFTAHAILSFVVAARVRRSEGRGQWMVVSGITDLILAAVIVMGLWAGAVWLIGLLAAVNLVFAGSALLAIGVGARVRP